MQKMNFNEEEYKKGYGSRLDSIEENQILREEFKTIISKYKYPSELAIQYGVLVKGSVSKKHI